MSIKKKQFGKNSKLTDEILVRMEKIFYEQFQIFSEISNSGEVEKDVEKFQKKTLELFFEEIEVEEDLTTFLNLRKLQYSEKLRKVLNGNKQKIGL